MRAEANENKIFNLIMPSRILFYSKIIKERNNATYLWMFFVDIQPISAFFLSRVVWIEQINPYFCRQKSRPMNERGVMVVIETL